MIILGIDPGTAEMGWGVIRKIKDPSSKIKNGRIEYIDHGMIKTPSGEALSKRLVTIKRGVEGLVEAHAVDEIVIERVVFNVNAASAISVAQSYGVILLLAGERDLPVHEYNALEAKLIVAGHGRADKKLVQESIRKILRLKEYQIPVHAADALAIAICHVEKSNA
uniref:Crossover junction endodeoxyribonuclease RuvC n=1 Tax=candidate division WWE3 bacterium TaxID=2053526 RepID=A0A831Z0U1_UNCKA